MKKLLLLVALCLCTSVALAQTIEIVHLKNGSRIRGIITEQVPNKHLKIQTSDGNLFVYSYDEIEKITKEFPEQEPVSAYRNEIPAQRSAPAYRSRQNNASDSSFRPHYEGGTDLGYSIGVSSVDGTGRLNVSTTHGYRVIPNLYVGAGLGVDYYHDGSTYGIPIFADFRCYFTQQTVKPFLNFRIGYSVGDAEGLYFSPSIGANYKMLDVSLGYTYQKSGVLSVYYDPYDDDFYLYPDKANIGAITIKVGIRF